jgi:hypothetical protein
MPRAISVVAHSSHASPACQRGSGPPLNLVVRRRCVTVGITEIQEARVLKSMEDFLRKRRLPPNIRHELDLAYRISGQSVEIFEIRRKWRGKIGETMEHPVAKATYVGTLRHWRVVGQFENR